MKIYYEDNHLMIIYKPANIPSQKDSSHDTDITDLVKNYLKVTYNKPGNVYCGLIHRLDRPVSGLLMIGKTSKATQRLSAQLQNHEIIKRYLVKTEHPLPLGKHTHFLIKDTKTNTTKTTNAHLGKKAELSVLSSKQINNSLYISNIELHTGRSHQIRVQCQALNAPIWGDQRYNPRAKKGQQIALVSHYLQFKHPTTKEVLTFEIDFEGNLI